MHLYYFIFLIEFFFSSRRRHTRWPRDWSSDVCSSDLNPNIVASHDFVCSVLLDDSNIIAKGGAQGVYCLSLREEKLSIALKVLSGTELLWPLIVAELLEKINYKNKETIQRLLELRTDKITNDAGKVIGETKVLL